MCRSEAIRLHALKPKFDALGCNLVCLLKENIPEQVDSFLAGSGKQGEFWGVDTPLYLDNGMTFFRALGGGKLRKGGLSSFLPFAGFWKRYAKIKDDVADHNLDGEGSSRAGCTWCPRRGSTTSTSRRTSAWRRRQRRFSPRARLSRKSE